MNWLEYLDFDMLFEKSGDGYVARVLNSPCGQASSSFDLPFSPFEIENLLLRVGRTRRGVRRLESPEMEAARTFGGRLFASVFDNEVLGCLRSSLSECYRRGIGLRLRMRFSSAPELGDLPWEFLFDSTRNQFLVLSVETPLVRYLDLPQDIQPLGVSPPLNVLAMIASPLDYPALDVEREWAKLKEALGDLEARGLVALTRLETASLASLQRQLRRGRYHIFHYIGHGGFDQQAQDGVLLTEAENGRGRPVSGNDLGTLLHDHRSLRLAVLNACEGARSSLSDPFAGTAQSLVQKGIPAVIAMQFEITDEAAINLAHEFYGALADGFPVDAALAEARKAIFAGGNDVEWATPVLYLRAPNAAIFQIDPSAAPSAGIEPRRTVSPDAQVEAEVARFYTQGLSDYWLDDWEQAIEHFEAVLRLKPGHAEAAARLADAQRRLALERLSRQAQAAEAGRDWAGAVAALEQLLAQAPGDPAATARLANARKQKQLEELYTEARQLNQAGEWQAVIRVFSQVTELDPSTPDPEGLLPAAQRALAAQQRQAALEDSYRQGVHLLDSGQWAEAARLLRQVQEQQPDYKHTARLMARAEAELARARVQEELTRAQATSPQEEAPVAVPIQSRAIPVTAPEEAVQAVSTVQVQPSTPTRPLENIRLPKPAARAVWVLALGSFLASLFVEFFAKTAAGYNLIVMIKAASNYNLGYEYAAYIFTTFSTGLLSGTAVWAALRSAGIHPTRFQTAGLLVAWTGAHLLTYFFNPYDSALMAVLFGWLLAGVLGGWATAAILRKQISGIEQPVFLRIIAGWVAAVVLREWLVQVVYFGDIHPAIYNSVSDELATRIGIPLFIGLFHGVEGLAAGLVMFALLSSVASGTKLAAVSAVREGGRPEEGTVETPAQSAQKHGAPSLGRSASLPKPVTRAARLLALGWFVAGLFSVLVANSGLGSSLIAAIQSASNDSLAYEHGWYLVVIFTGGLLSGLAIWLALRTTGVHLTRRQVIGLLAAWTGSNTFTFLFYDPYELVLVRSLFGWVLAGALAGSATAAILRKQVSGFDRPAFLRTITGWAAASLLGDWLIQILFWQGIYRSLHDSGAGEFADRIGIPLFIGLFNGLVGLLGGLVMFSQLSRLFSREQPSGAKDPG